MEVNAETYAASIVPDVIYLIRVFVLISGNESGTEPLRGHTNRKPIEKNIFPDLPNQLLLWSKNKQKTLKQHNLFTTVHMH